MEMLEGIYRWLWTDAGFVFQLILGALITWAVFWFIRRMHPEQPVGEVIRAHFQYSKGLGLYGIVFFLGFPPLFALQWLCYQGTCWLVTHFPRAGAAWVELTRSFVMAWREAMRQVLAEIEQKAESRRKAGLG